MATKAPNNFYTKTLPAGSSDTIAAPGAVLSVKTATLPVMVAMNGGASVPIQSGTVLDGPFTSLTFTNSNSVSVTITFYCGAAAVAFAPQDNSETVNATYLLSCGGTAGTPVIIKALNGVAGNWTTQTGAPVANLVNLLAIPGVNNGHRRKQITFQNSTLNGNSSDVMIFDSAGNPFARLLANNTPYTWESSDTFYVGGLGGGTTAGSFIYSEIYYAANV